MKHVPEWLPPSMLVGSGLVAPIEWTSTVLILALLAMQQRVALYGLLIASAVILWLSPSWWQAGWLVTLYIPLYINAFPREKSVDEAMQREVALWKSRTEILSEKVTGEKKELEGLREEIALLKTLVQVSHRETEVAEARLSAQQQRQVINASLHAQPKKKPAISVRDLLG